LLPREETGPGGYCFVKGWEKGGKKELVSVVFCGGVKFGFRRRRGLLRFRVVEKLESHRHSLIHEGAR